MPLLCYGTSKGSNSLQPAPDPIATARLWSFRAGQSLAGRQYAPGRAQEDPGLGSDPAPAPAPAPAPLFSAKSIRVGLAITIAAAVAFSAFLAGPLAVLPRRHGRLLFWPETQRPRPAALPCRRLRHLDAEAFEAASVQGTARRAPRGPCTALETRLLCCRVSPSASCRRGSGGTYACLSRRSSSEARLSHDCLPASGQCEAGRGRDCRSSRPPPRSRRPAESRHR